MDSLELANICQGKINYLFFSTLFIKRNHPKLQGQPCCSSEILGTVSGLSNKPQCSPSRLCLSQPHPQDHATRTGHLLSLS